MVFNLVPVLASFTIYIKVLKVDIYISIYASVIWTSAEVLSPVNSASNSSAAALMVEILSRMTLIDSGSSRSGL